MGTPLELHSFGCARIDWGEDDLRRQAHLVAPTMQDSIVQRLLLLPAICALLLYGFLFALQRFFRRLAMVVLRNCSFALALLFASFIGPSTANSAAAQGASPPAPTQTISQKIAASKTLLDINTATPDQLKALPGFGDAYTKRVIDGRPYTAKNQLVTRGIIPQATYDNVKDQIIAHRPKP
jgi:competence protein ComEA